MAETQRLALVTGGNRGLGLETCRQLCKKNYHVILTARSGGEGTAAVDKLSDDGHTISFFKLDVTNKHQVEELSAHLRQEHSRLDVLVNNAGLFPGGETNLNPFTASLIPISEAFEINVRGALHLCQALIPLMRENKYGRVVNVSSGMGQLSEMEGGYPAYRISKAALNAVTRIFSVETEGQNILVNSVCPGWVRTRMGGENAPRNVVTGAEGIVWAATLPDDGPTGGFFRDGELIAW